MADLPLIAPDAPAAPTELPTILPDPHPVAATAPTDNLPVIAPDQSAAPQGAQPGFFSGLYRGMGESMKGVGQTAGLVSGTATPSQPQADDALNQELKKSFFQGMFDPHWWTSQLGHAIGSAGPMVGGAIAGSAAAEAVAPETGPVAPLAGAALGGGLGNMIQTLGPTVKDNMAKGQNFNDALDSALKTTGMESTIVGAMSAVPGGKLLGTWAAGTAKRAISEALINILGVQPGIGLVGQAGIDVAENKPITLDDLLTGYVQNVGLGAALHAGHVAAGKLLPGKPAGETEAPPPPPPALGKTTDDLLREMGTSTPPPAPGLPGVTTALPRTTEETGPALTPPIPSPDNTGQSGPVPSGEQVVKSGEGQVNAKPAIIDAEQPPAPEHVTDSAVRVNGQVYTGKTHLEALDTALRDQRLAGADATNLGPSSERNLFVTNQGRVVTPEQAVDLPFADDLPAAKGRTTVPAQPLEAAPAPELRGPTFEPTATEHLPEIQPNQPTQETALPPAASLKTQQEIDTIRASADEAQARGNVGDAQALHQQADTHQAALDTSIARTPVTEILDSKPPTEPMPKAVTDNVAQGTHDTNDAIGEMLQQAAAGGGSGREPPKPPTGGGPPAPDKGRRSLLGTADRIIAAVNTMPDDPLSYNRMSAAARVFGLAPGVAAADRTGATYLDSLTERDATKHAGVFDGEAAAKDYGGLSYKRRAPIDKVIEYFNATGQEIPKPHADGSMTLTMDPKAFGELPWMLQLSKPGESVHLDPKQVKALTDVRDFLDRRWNEIAESAARKVGYDGRFLTTDADGKLQIDLPTIKHAFDTATDKGLKKTAERALGIATAAKESKRVSYFPNARYGDWTIRVTPKVPLTGTGHALPGETWFEKVESGTPFDTLKGVAKSTYGNQAPRKVTQRVAELEKQFPPDKYDISYTSPQPKLRDSIDVPMVERVLDDIEFKDEHGDPVPMAGLKDAVIESMYQKMLAGFRQHREGIPGASTDFPRALGDYIRQSAGVVANAKHSRAVDEAYLNTQQHRDPRTRSYWAAHKVYNDGNDSRIWSAARKVGFFKYLWGSPMSAMIQLTQTPMITGSQLSGVIGPRGMWMVHTAMMRALQAMRVDGNGAKVAVESLKGSLTPGEYAGLMQAFREGRLNPVLPHSLGGGTMSAKMRNSPIFKVPSRLYDMGSSMFNAADTANRVASWLSYYRAAQLPGAAAKFAKAYKNDALFQQAVGDHVDPTRLANWAVFETQFMSGRQGGAPIMRGPGSLAFQFQHYNSNYIRLLHKNFTRMGPQGKVAGTMMLAGLMGAGGVLGFPFARDAEDAADAIGKFVFGIDPRIDAHIREFLADSGMAKLADGYLGLAPGTTGEMLAEGPSEQVTGMALGQRIGLGHMLPGSTDLTTGVPFLDATVGAAIEAHKRYATQQPLGAMAALMPAGLENPMKALAVYPNEGVKQASGTNVLSPSQVTTGMKIARGLGATPATIARKQQAMSDANRITYATDQATKDLKAAIVGQYGLFEDAQKRGDTATAAGYAAKAQQLIKDNLDRLHDPSVPAWQQIPLPSPGQIRAGIMKYMNPFQIRNSKTMRSKQAELAASPYLQQ